MSQKQLSERERAFAIAYTGKAQGNITKAAEMAGYSLRSAPQSGYRLLKRAHVRQYIDARRQKLTGKLDISDERILQELAAVAFGNIAEYYNPDGTLKPVHELPEAAQRSLSALIPTKDGAFPKAWDKIKALEMLAKHKALLNTETSQSARVTVQIGFLNATPQPVTIDVTPDE